jgi:hypothetical protein
MAISLPSRSAVKVSSPPGGEKRAAFSMAFTRAYSIRAGWT